MKKSVKKALITAIILVICGAVMFAAAMSSLDFDFKKLSTENPIEKTSEITENFENIEINTDATDITIIYGENPYVKYEGQEITDFSARTENGNLKINCTDNKVWYQNIGVQFYGSKLTVYLPDREYKNLTVNSASGNVILKTSVKGNMKISTSSGNVKLENCDAERLDIKTSSGDVSGTIKTDKIFDVKTASGDVDLPKTQSGGICKVTTSSGNIKFEIEK